MADGLMKISKAIDEDDCLAGRKSNALTPRMQCKRRMLYNVQKQQEIQKTDADVQHPPYQAGTTVMLIS